MLADRLRAWDNRFRPTATDRAATKPEAADRLPAQQNSLHRDNHANLAALRMRQVQHPLGSEADVERTPRRHGPTKVVPAAD